MNHKEYIIPIGQEAQDYDEMFIGVIRRQPELVRCKDCVKYKKFGDGYCPWIEQEVEEDFFCADGKREEE